jgi:hypothetical protein
LTTDHSLRMVFGMGRTAASKSTARKSAAAKPASASAVVYLRVSTARQAAEGIGLDAQEAKCRAHAERMGWPVLAVHKDEGVSGRDGVEDRAGLQAAIAAVKANPGAVVVVYSVSRAVNGCFGTSWTIARATACRCRRQRRRSTRRHRPGAPCSA